MSRSLPRVVARTVAEQLEPRRLLSDVVAVGLEFRVNTFTTGSQFYSRAAIAADANGNFVVAWQNIGQDGSGYGVYAQRYNAAGAAQGAEFRVNTFTAGHQNEPTVAMDADGDFVIAWQSDRGFPSGYDVYAQRYSAAGVPQGAEFRVNTYTTNFQNEPSIAMDALGDFVVAWQSADQDGSAYGVYGRRYNAAGTAQGGEFRANTHTNNSQTFPTAAMDADGDFVIAWQSGYQDGSNQGVYAKRYNASGVVQGGEFRVNTYTTERQWFPSIAMGAAGNFVIIWEDLGGADGSSLGVFGQRYDSAGVAQGIEFRVNSYTTDGQGRPSVTCDAAGNFLVAWESNLQDGSARGIYAQRFDAGGAPQQSEFRVNTYTTDTQQFPAVAMDRDGDFVVAWDSNGQDGSNNSVYAQRYAVVPSVTASEFDFATAPHRLRFTFDHDVSAALGTDDLVVENLTTMQTVPSGDFTLAYAAGANLATFTYIGTGGVLPDGNYRAKLLAAGTTLPADHVYTFHFLRGDANHDGRVNLQDFNILATNFGQSPRDFTQGDFDYSGTVNLNDFNILASRFGQVLAAPGAGASAADVSRRGDAWLEDLLA